MPTLRAVADPSVCIIKNIPAVCPTYIFIYIAIKTNFCYNVQSYGCQDIPAA